MKALWRVCPACKTVNEEAICLVCGRSLIDIEATARPRRPKRRRIPKPRSRRRIFTALIAVLCVAAVAVAGIFILGGQPDMPPESEPEPETDAYTEPDTYILELKWAAQTVLAKSMEYGRQLHDNIIVEGEYGYYIEDGQAVYSAYLSNGTNATIPSEIDGYPVTAIGTNAFYLGKHVRSIRIPGSVKYIGNNAFDGCRELKMIIIPDSVVYIDGHAFKDCEQLSSFSIPDSVAYIGYDTFIGTAWFDALDDEFCVVGDGVLIKYNGNEADIVIPDGVKVIAGGVFEQREELDSVVIPDGVSLIGGNAFYECEWLAEVTIPASVVEIEGLAFYDTDWLERKTDDFVIVNDILIKCNLMDENIIVRGAGRIGECAFYECSWLKSIEIRGGVTEIGSYAFIVCENLERVTFPGSVKRIGRCAFYRCESLRGVYFEGDAPYMHYYRNYDWHYYLLDLTIYHTEGASGWDDTTFGYDTAIWE